MNSLSKILPIIFLPFIIFCCKSGRNKEISEKSLREKGIFGKVEWKPVLAYTLDLHKKSTHKKTYPFIYDWEEIGPGYCYAPAFGHWDIVHQVLDALVYEREHGLRQLYNNIANQEASGMLPGSIWMPEGKSKRYFLNFFEVLSICII